MIKISNSNNYYEIIEVLWQGIAIHNIIIYNSSGLETKQYSINCVIANQIKLEQSLNDQTILQFIINQ